MTFRDLAKKAKWVGEAIGPADDMVHGASRTLADLPVDVTPGARHVAVLTAWRTAQDWALKPVMDALNELSKLNDWSCGFLVADCIGFDWKTAPYKRYTSFEHFYREELEETWGKWGDLQETYRRYVDGDLTEDDATERIAAGAAASRAERAQALAGPDGVDALPLPMQPTEAGKLGGRGHKACDKITGFSGRGTAAPYLIARLKRDHPAVAERLAAGEFRSARAAARAAGIVRDRTPLDTLRAAWRKASPADRAAFLADIALAPIQPKA